jgi:hypothetical protein
MKVENRLYDKGDSNLTKKSHIYIDAPDSSGLNVQYRRKCIVSEGKIVAVKISVDCVSSQVGKRREVPELFRE